MGGEEPETYREILENFEAGARDVGKDPTLMPRMVELAVAYTDDEASAIEYRKKYWAGTFVPALFTERIYTPKMAEENGKAVGAEVIKEAVCISADAEDHIKLVQHYIDMGFDHLIFHSAGPDQRGFLEAYGHEVLPRLREARKIQIGRCPGFETVTARPTFYRRAQSLDQRLRLRASGRVAAPAGVIVQIASAASIFSTSDSVTAKFS